MSPWLHRIDPIALQFPEFSVFGMSFHPAVHWYGLMYALGFAAAWWLGRRRIRQGRLPGVGEAAFGDLLFYGMLGVILGGRLGYILFYDLPTYLDQPLQVFRIWEGGMSFHGGLLGVCIAAWWWARRQGLHFFDVIDFVAPLVPPGLGLGRVGNYINGELWGKYTEAGWGVIFPGAEAPLAYCACNSAGGRRARPLCAPSLAAVPGGAGRPRPVRGAVVVLQQAEAAVCRCRHVRVALWRVPLRRRVRPRPRCAARLPGVRLADDGPGAQPAADPGRARLVVVVAALADAATGAVTKGARP